MSDGSLETAPITSETNHRYRVAVFTVWALLWLVLVTGCRTTAPYPSTIDAEDSAGLFLPIPPESVGAVCGLPIAFPKYARWAPTRFPVHNPCETVQEGECKRMSIQGSLTPRFAPQLVWTGTEVIAWGGCTFVEGQLRWVSDGARFDPRENVWKPIPPHRAPKSKPGKAMWTTRGLLVMGGLKPGESAFWDPEQDRWTPLTQAELSVVKSTRASGGRSRLQAIVAALTGADGRSLRDDDSGPIRARQRARFRAPDPSLIPKGFGIGTDGGATVTLDIGRVGHDRVVTALDFSRFWLVSTEGAWRPLQDSFGRSAPWPGRPPPGGHRFDPSTSGNRIWNAVWTGTQLVAWGGLLRTWWGAETCDQSSKEVDSEEQCDIFEFAMPVGGAIYTPPAR